MVRLQMAARCSAVDLRSRCRYPESGSVRDGSTAGGEGRVAKVAGGCGAGGHKTVPVALKIGGQVRYGA
jgi:hypothetical protein